MKTRYDSEEFYCPKLGHHLTFSYCRSERVDLPCARIAACCSGRIPVLAYLSEHYPEAMIQEISQIQGDKMATILAMIARAKTAENPDS